MREHFQAVLEHLRRLGWDIRIQIRPRAIPPEIGARFPWIPPDVRELIEETEVATSPDEKAWFLTSAVLTGQAGFAYSWDEWERMSLAAAKADNDSEWQARIREFWNRHFPIIQSVKSAYAYFAVREDDLAIVHGEEPDFEEAEDFAPSLREFLRMVQAADPKLRLWI